ncbi:hypothetical protein LQZ19_07550 [Treponema primitia]|uniref:hypothetical protein n=1 Tax=Treponema primitia TaxID=88058 RepID=UPI00397F8A27
MMDNLFTIFLLLLFLIILICNKFILAKNTAGSIAAAFMPRQLSLPFVTVQKTVPGAIGAY